MLIKVSKSFQPLNIYSKVDFESFGLHFLSNFFQYKEKKKGVGTNSFFSTKEPSSILLGNLL